MNIKENSPLQLTQTYSFDTNKQLWYENVSASTLYYMIVQLDEIYSIENTVTEAYKYIASGKLYPFQNQIKLDLNKYCKVNYDDRVDIDVDNIFAKQYIVQNGFKFLILFNTSDLSTNLSAFTVKNGLYYSDYATVTALTYTRLDEIIITNNAPSYINKEYVIGDTFFVQSYYEEYAYDVNVGFINGVEKLISVNNIVENEYTRLITEIFISSQIDTITFTYDSDDGEVYDVIDINNNECTELAVRYIKPDLSLATLPFKGSINTIKSVSSITGQLNTKKVQIGKSIKSSIKANTGLGIKDYDWQNFGQSLYYAYTTNVDGDVYALNNYYNINQWDETVLYATTNATCTVTYKENESINYNISGTRNTGITNSVTFTMSPYQSTSQGFIFQFLTSITSGTFQLLVDGVVKQNIGGGIIQAISTNVNPTMTIKATNTANTAFNINVYDEMLLINNSDAETLLANGYFLPDKKYYWRDLNLDLETFETSNGITLGNTNKEVIFEISDNEKETYNYVTKGFFE